MDCKKPATAILSLRCKFIAKIIVTALFSGTLYALAAPFAEWPVFSASIANMALRYPWFAFWVAISLFGLLLHAMFPKTIGEDRRAWFWGYAWILVLSSFFMGMIEVAGSIIVYLVYLRLIQGKSSSDVSS